MIVLPTGEHATFSGGGLSYVEDAKSRDFCKSGLGVLEEY